MKKPSEIQKILIEVIRQTIQKGPKNKSLITRQEANGGTNNIYFDSFSFEKDRIEPSLVRQVDGIAGEKYTPSILRTCQDIYINTVLWTAPGPITYDVVERLSLEEANNIYHSISGNENFFVEVTLLTEVRKQSLAILDWRKIELNIHERSIRAHQSGIAAGEYLSRLFNTTTLRKDMKKFVNDNPENIVEDVEHFSLAISLGLGRPVTIDDISIIPRFWKFTPDIPFNFMRLHGYWYGSPRDASTIKFWTDNLNGTFMKDETEEHLQKCKAWFEILTEIPQAKYPLNMIQRGLWQIFSSSNAPSYISKNLTMVGLTDVLLGMEGLISRTSSSEKQSAVKFKKAWRKIIDSFDLTEKFPRARSARKISERLYNLRCVIAHGGNESLSAHLKALKFALGDNWNPGDYRLQSVAFLLAQWTTYILQEFPQNQQLIKELYVESDATGNSGLTANLISKYLRKLLF